MHSFDAWLCALRCDISRRSAEMVDYRKCTYRQMQNRAHIKRERCDSSQTHLRRKIYSLFRQIAANFFRRIRSADVMSCSWWPPILLACSMLFFLATTPAPSPSTVPPYTAHLHAIRSCARIKLFCPDNAAHTMPRTARREHSGAVQPFRALIVLYVLCVWIYVCLPLIQQLLSSR